MPGTGQSDTLIDGDFQGRIIYLTTNYLQVPTASVGIRRQVSWDVRLFLEAKHEP